MLVHPFSCCKIQDVSHNLEPVVNGSLLSSLLFFPLDKRLEGSHVDRIQWQAPDEWAQHFEVTGIAPDRCLVGLPQVLRCGLPKGSIWPHAKDTSLSDLVDPTR